MCCHRAISFFSISHERKKDKETIYHYLSFSAWRSRNFHPLEIVHSRRTLKRACRTYDRPFYLDYS